MGAVGVNLVRTCVETCSRTVDDYLIFFFFQVENPEKQMCVKYRSKAVVFL